MGWYKIKEAAGSRITDRSIGSANGGSNKCGTEGSCKYSTLCKSFTVGNYIAICKIKKNTHQKRQMDITRTISYSKKILILQVVTIRLMELNPQPCSPLK